MQSCCANLKCGTRSATTEIDLPDGEIGTTATDEPDGGVYVDVNVYVLNWDKCCTRCFPPVSDSDHNPSCHWENIVHV